MSYHEETQRDFEFACRYKGWCVFIDYSQRDLFAVPEDKIEPDSDLSDDDIILGNSFQFIKLIIDSREATTESQGGQVG
jgi:hypothetical protein